VNGILIISLNLDSGILTPVKKFPTVKVSGNKINNAFKKVITPKSATHTLLKFYLANTLRLNIAHPCLKPMYGFIYYHTQTHVGVAKRGFDVSYMVTRAILSIFNRMNFQEAPA